MYSRLQFPRNVPLGVFGHRIVPTTDAIVRRYLASLVCVKSIQATLAFELSEPIVSCVIDPIRHERSSARAVPSVGFEPTIPFGLAFLRRDCIPVPSTTANIDFCGPSRIRTRPSWIKSPVCSHKHLEPVRSVKFSATAFRAAHQGEMVDDGMPAIIAITEDVKTAADLPLHHLVESHLLNPRCLSRCRKRSRESTNR